MWYVVQVQARHELEIVEKCRDIVKPGEEVFTMLTERKERRDGEWKPVRAVTFQKYIFADTDDPDDFRIRLRGVPDMTKFLTVGGEVVPIHPEEERLLGLLGGENHIIGGLAVHKEGDRVTIADGPLAGMEGLVRWTDRRQKWIGIAVSLAGRETVIKLGAEYLAPDEKKLLNPEDE